MEYARQRIGVTTLPELAERLIAHCTKLDMRAMAEDVRLFVFNAETLEDVVQFARIVEGRWIGR